MSTRCTIHFCWGEKTIAKIYRHSDGYPDGPHGVPADLLRFFAAVEEQTTDTRYRDPSFLAAKFVVWQAAQFAGEERSLDFLSVGVVDQDPPDIEYRYLVDCENHVAGRPQVNFQKRIRDGWDKAMPIDGSRHVLAEQGDE